MSTISLAHKTYKLGFDMFSPIVHAKDITEIKVRYNDYNIKCEDFNNKSGYQYITFTTLVISYNDSNGEKDKVFLKRTKDDREMRGSDWEILFEELFEDSDKYIGDDIKFYHVPFIVTSGKSESMLNEELGECDYINQCRFFDDQCFVCEHNENLEDRGEFDSMYCPKDDKEALEMGWEI